MGRVLVVELRIRLYLSQSLKDKRRVRLRMTERLRQRYNLSIAETAAQDNRQMLELTMAYVALSETAARDMEQTLRDEVDGLLEGEGETVKWQADLF